MANASAAAAVSSSKTPIISLEKEGNKVVAVCSLRRSDGTCREVRSNPCSKRGHALNSLKKALAKQGIETSPTDQWVIKSDLDIPESASDFEAEEFEKPQTQELPQALQTSPGLINPVEHHDRWVMFYKMAKEAVGGEGTMADIAITLKALGCASPFERDGDGKPFHMYADSLIQAPKPGEGERRQLPNNNGFLRDSQGRTPVEPGSRARETDARHPANRTRGNGIHRGQPVVAQKNEERVLRPTSFKFGNLFGINVPDGWEDVGETTPPKDVVEITKFSYESQQIETRAYEAVRGWTRNKKGTGWVTTFPRRVA